MQQGLRFLVLYLAAYKLGPALFGTINIILLYNSYLLNANLGAVNGLKRQIPIKYKLIGGTDAEKASFNILLFNTVSSIFWGTVIAVLFFLYNVLNLKDSIYLVVLCVCNGAYFYVQTLVIANQYWNKLKLLQAGCSLVLLLSAIALWFLGKDAFLWVYALSFLLPAIMLILREVKIYPFDFSYIKENIKIGFPIMIAGLVFFLFQTMDRLIITKNYPKEAMGFYALATTLVAGYALITNLASEIILQKGIAYYIKVGANTKLRAYLFKITGAVLVCLLPILTVAYFLFKFIIEDYFPAYTSSLPIILNLTIAFFLQQCCIGTGNYYYIVRRQLTYNIVMVTSTTIAFCLLAYPYVFNFPDNIVDISQRMILCSVFYVILITVPAFTEVKEIK
ncbi:MAG: oligosaccharide flippase family protein [Chitinophagaceae bacterium]|nr:oligosaccharide flippase family protein [Chitinophagaceae bacterium]MCW5904048.1 oligosaccharide flippase family protein [Chitinophagaceae bacterium]